MKNIFDGKQASRFLLDEHGMWSNPSPVEQSVAMVYREMENRKHKLIKEKLSEKGFAHLIDGIKSKRFPKICCVVQNDWSFYYADNDTNEGAFIVAIEKFKVDDSLKEPYKITVSFRYQDTYNGEIKIL